MNNESASITPLIVAFVLVYVLALLICGVLVDGTIALAFATVGLMAAIAAFIGVEMSRKLGD
jgi:hypothetical protein